VILTNKDLRRLFRKFNKIYFGSQIDSRTIVRFADIEDGDEGETSDFCQSTERGRGGTILIAKAYRRWPNPACTTLIHEMIHVYLGYEYLEPHGYRFAAEINRLWNMGFYETLL
jgi:hypothetical protein